MMNINECYFEDLFSTAFFFDVKEKRMEVYFGEFSTKKHHFDGRCRLVIQGWENAMSKISSDDKFVDVEENIGVVSMILNLSEIEGRVEITVNTLDDRYVDIVFMSATGWVEKCS